MKLWERLRRAWEFSVRPSSRINFSRLGRCGILSGMMKLSIALLFAVGGLAGCSTPNISRSGTLLSGLTQYHGDMQSLSSVSRWPERQRAAGSLKTIITGTVGASPEFYRLVDLDLRKREFTVTMRDSNLRPDRLREMQDELVAMDEEIAALKPVVKTQLSAVANHEQGDAYRKCCDSRSTRHGRRQFFLRRRFPRRRRHRRPESVSIWSPIWARFRRCARPMANPIVAMFSACPKRAAGLGVNRCVGSMENRESIQLSAYNSRQTSSDVISWASLDSDISRTFDQRSRTCAFSPCRKLFPCLQEFVSDLSASTTNFPRVRSSRQSSF